MSAIINRYEPTNYRTARNPRPQTNEAKIYLALVELGRGTVTEVSKMASLNRTTGYDILEPYLLYGLANRASLGTKTTLCRRIASN